MSKRPRAGRRPIGDNPMRQIAIRLPLELIEKLDEKVERLSADPLLKAERSTLIRVLIEEAIEARRRTRNW